MDDDDTTVLTELQRPDDRTLPFSPYGLGGRLTPEDAARFQASSIARAVLADDVPQGVRDNFERARQLHLYGVLDYEFFTAATDYALLVLEGALRVRFLSYYSGGIPVVRKGVEETLAARTFDDVRAARRKCMLRGSDGGRHDLPIGARALLEWARRERLLTGTRTRIVDRALAALRDHAAHPISYTLVMPPQSARTLTDVAEVINKLWGHDTASGRLFPAPMTRQPRVAGLAPDRSAATEMRLDQVHSVSGDQRNWLFAVFLAADSEELTTIGRDGLGFSHRPGHQTTLFPCEQLWEGCWHDLVEAIEGGAFSASVGSVQQLDRLFFIRADDDSIDDARSPADLLALRTPPEGHWYAVISDTPLDAWVHVRDHEGGSSDRGATCSECFARVEGRFEDAADVVALAREVGDDP